MHSWLLAMHIFSLFFQTKAIINIIMFLVYRILTTCRNRTVQKRIKTVNTTSFSNMRAFLLVLAVVALSAAQISSPALCDTWYSGYSYSIEWNPEDFGDSSVLIEFHDGGSLIVEVTETGNDGSFRWLVPFLQYQQYAFNRCTSTIVISSSTNPTGISSSLFGISNPVTFGNPSTLIYAPFNSVDTLFKIRWSGAIVCKRIPSIVTFKQNV
jgi:hypothetical protein